MFSEVGFLAPLHALPHTSPGFKTELDCPPSHGTWDSRRLVVE